jgi:hypothetical protein
MIVLRSTLTENAVHEKNSPMAPRQSWSNERTEHIKKAKKNGTKACLAHVEGLPVHSGTKDSKEYLPTVQHDMIKSSER